jgi:hypothetical protein
MPERRFLLPTGNKRWVPHCPDFLWRLVALIHFMRLSLMKGAHADLSSAAWQEIGVKPSFGLSGITAIDVPHQESLRMPERRFLLPTGNKCWVPVGRILGA